MLSRESENASKKVGKKAGKSDPSVRTARWFEAANELGCDPFDQLREK
jgi:hypothetical protein